MCQKNRIDVIERVSHTLYDTDEILRTNNHIIPNTYEEFKNICQRIGEPIEAVPRPDLNFFSLHLTRTNDLYEESLHRVPDLAFFNMRPECPQQNNMIFIGGEQQVCLKCIFFL